MQFKRGNKVLCKNYCSENFEFIENKIYYIRNFTEEQIFISEFKNSNKGAWFYLNKNKKGSKFYYYKYFYTEKEMRMMKLKQL